MSIAETNNNNAQDFHRTVIHLICEYVGGKLICVNGCIKSSPYLARHWGRRAEIKQEYSPAHFGDFMLFTRFYKNGGNFLVRHCNTAHSGKNIIYRLGGIRIPYRPINSILCQLILVGPRILVRSILGDFRRLAKTCRPTKYYRKCQLEKKPKITQPEKGCWGLKSLINEQ